ncbi:MAG: uracil-DNA glycosylase, partial [Parvularculaceae bacterium]|nr:uracil-DNA glycosylase [Parvularculaceae bacterium]
MSLDDAATRDPVFGPPHNCRQCPRLAAFLDELRVKEPDWHNAPVPSFGDPDAALLIVGLAPGMKGANRTGRPFTGDYAGDLLYATLGKFGFSSGEYASSPDDGLILVDAMITNAVRCVPPQNKPVGAEIRNCRPFLTSRITALPKLKAIVCLGRIAHDSTLAALGIKAKDAPFAHGAEHDIAGGPRLFDSYHCSRYNTNTRRLTEDMFEQVFASVRRYL